MAPTTKRPTAEDVERLTARMQKLEARLASMVGELKGVKTRLADATGNGGPPATAGRGPPTFWDEDPHEPVALVRRGPFRSSTVRGGRGYRSSPKARCYGVRCGKAR